jgi:stage II sporulation protein P
MGDNMDKSNIYNRGRRIATIYLVIIIIIGVLIISKLLENSIFSEKHYYLEDMTKKINTEGLIDAFFTLNPTLEYMYSKKEITKGPLHKTEQFTSYSIPLLSYVFNYNENKNKTISEIYPNLDKVKEENAVETFVQDEKFNSATIENQLVKSNFTKYTMDQLTNLTFLKNNLYTVDATINVNESDFDIKYFMLFDPKINLAQQGPKILIYHTHSQENFIDSRDKNKNDTVVGVGDELTRILEEEYNLKVYHFREEFDIINGKLDRSKAYQLIEKPLKKILKENPSIEVAIDLHRDGIPDNIKLVKQVNNKPTAKLMFFNGLCKTMVNGKMQPIQSIKNPYVKDNMAFSFQMQMKANELYPGLTRKIYLKGYRYNLHILPKTLLIEVGAQTNKVGEAKNAMIPLAKILSEVIAK